MQVLCKMFALYLYLLCGSYHSPKHKTAYIKQGLRDPVIVLMSCRSAEYLAITWHMHTLSSSALPDTSLPKRKGQLTARVDHHTTSTHLVYLQWSWHSHTETRGPIITPAAACAPGIVAKPTQAVFVLNESYSLRGLQNLHRGTRSVCAMILSGSILDLAHRIQLSDRRQC